MVVQSRVVSPETIYTPPTKVDSLGRICVFAHTHTYTHTSNSQRERGYQLETGGRVPRRYWEEEREGERGVILFQFKTYFKINQ